MIKLLLIFLVVYICWKIYVELYFSGKNFKKIKKSILEYVDECNEFNRYVDSIKERDNEIFANENVGEICSYNENIGFYKYQRKGLHKEVSTDHLFECSATVFRNASHQPIKYLCKYFDIEINEKNLEHYEAMLNNYMAIEEGKNLILEYEDEILQSISQDIPHLIMKYSFNRLVKELEFEPVDLSEDFFPRYTFRYVSPSGNSSQQFDIVLNIKNLEALIEYFSQKIDFQKTAKGQRQLMTKKLREYIKKRDNYTCRYCKISIHDEPHLLLEVDHILPIAKGGLTKEENLQTLCWKCNRSKGKK